MNITVLLTAYREPRTVGKAIAAFLPQLPAHAELLVVCPDAETTAVVQKLARQDGRIRHIPDPAHGKPTALNIGLQAARGDIIIFSDGDVTIADNALTYLLAPFTESNVGAVTGRPISISPRHTCLGYWSHLLTDSAHHVRLARDQTARFLLCSGYLFAARRALIPSIPTDALAEDAVISHRIAEQGYRIRYAPQAIVYVKYPDNYQDWLRQKVRSAGGYAQTYVRKSPIQMRSPWREVADGTWLALRYPRSLRELGWTLALFGARLHLWGAVFWQVRVRKRPLSTLWQRVESTK
ncbi:MAG: glycosyltransferase [Chloroflexi bacterium]|nr:MAG: glycosyltransferase [Chloroflexota bacterium]